MKLPQSLNPLRGTALAWLLPLSWAIIQWAARTAPITLEVFIHRRFGGRSGMGLIRGFVLLLIVSLASAQTHPRVPLFSWFLVAYMIAAIGQWIVSISDPQAGPVHSYSTGEPWPIWRRFPFAMPTVQRYLEPLYCCIIAIDLLFLDLDPSLAHWIFIGAIALFIQEQVRHFRLRTRRLDAADNRIEGEALMPRARAENEAFVEARPAPPRPRRRQPGPGPGIRPH